jgi:hypothetical protein
MMKMGKGKIGKGREQPGEGIFALSTMKLAPETSTRFVSLNYDKLAANLGMADGKEASMAGLAKVKEIAARHYGEGMRQWGTADESSSSTFFSKEGDPTYIAVNFKHKLELFTVKTYGLPDEVHKEIEAALARKGR